MLLHRHLHHRGKVSRSLNSGPASKSSFSAETSIPTLTQHISCKANASSNFARFLSLSAEIQWKASQQKPNKSTSTINKQQLGRQRRLNRLSIAKEQSAVAADEQAVPVSNDTCPSACNSDPFSARSRCLPIPAPVYAGRPKREQARHNPGGRRANRWQGGTDLLEGEEEKEKEGQMQKSMHAASEVNPCW